MAVLAFLAAVSCEPYSFCLYLKLSPGGKHQKE